MRPINRRRFIERALLSVLSLPLLSLAQLLLTKSARASSKSERKPNAGQSGAKPKAGPLPAGAQAASESDPVAQAMGYHSDASQTDFKKYPKRKKPENQNQYCMNCSLYKAENESWGKCQLITSGLVAAPGWCGSYSPAKGKA